MKKITFRLLPQSVERAERKLKRAEAEWDKKIDELLKRLADLGAGKARVGFSKAIYDGKKDVSVSVKQIKNGYSIVADGESVLFIEFGSGVRYGYGHPKPMQYGPGTYPSTKGRRDSGGNVYLNWEHPNGWWTPKDAGGIHTYGNPPSATMYCTAQELEREILNIAKEVFHGS